MAVAGRLRLFAPQLGVILHLGKLSAQITAHIGVTRHLGKLSAQITAHISVIRQLCKLPEEATLDGVRLRG